MFQGFWIYYVYIFAFALGGVILGGLPVLAAVSFLYPPTHKIFRPIPCILIGAFSGWLAMALISFVFAYVLTSQSTHKAPGDIARLLLFSLCGSVYGILGFSALGFLTRRSFRNAEQGAAANP
jgi:hypothetical protein